MKLLNRRNKTGVAFVFLMVLLLAAYFLFFQGSSNDMKQLEGMWIRSDGPYKIEIKEVQAEGKLLAMYFNPDPINVGRSAWRIQKERMHVYIELKDENYPGSIYRLTYDDQLEMLKGTYFQAVAQQSYEVNFIRVKE